MISYYSLKSGTAQPAEEPDYRKYMSPMSPVYHLVKTWVLQLIGHERKDLLEGKDLLKKLFLIL